METLATFFPKSWLHSGHILLLQLLLGGGRFRIVHRLGPLTRNPVQFYPQKCSACSRRPRSGVTTPPPGSRMQPEKPLTLCAVLPCGHFMPHLSPTLHPVPVELTFQALDTEASARLGGTFLGSSSSTRLASSEPCTVIERDSKARRPEPCGLQTPHRMCPRHDAPGRVVGHALQLAPRQALSGGYEASGQHPPPITSPLRRAGRRLLPPARSRRHAAVASRVDLRPSIMTEGARKIIPAF